MITTLINSSFHLTMNMVSQLRRSYGDVNEFPARIEFPDPLAGKMAEVVLEQVGFLPLYFFGWVPPEDSVGAAAMMFALEGRDKLLPNILLFNDTSDSYAGTASPAIACDKAFAYHGFDVRDQTTIRQEFVVLNFLGELSEFHKTEIESLVGSADIKYVLLYKYSYGYDTAGALMDRVIEHVSMANLTKREWQDKNIIVIPPTDSYVTLMALATMLGLMGHAPKVVRYGWEPDQLLHFRELIDLERIRESSQKAAEEKLGGQYVRVTRVFLLGLLASLRSEEVRHALDGVSDAHAIRAMADNLYREVQKSDLSHK